MKYLIIIPFLFLASCSFDTGQGTFVSTPLAKGQPTPADGVFFYQLPKEVEVEPSSK